MKTRQKRFHVKIEFAPFHSHRLRLINCWRRVESENTQKRNRGKKDFFLSVLNEFSQNRTSKCYSFIDNDARMISQEPRKLILRDESVSFFWCVSREILWRLYENFFATQNFLYFILFCLDFTFLSAASKWILFIFYHFAVWWNHRQHEAIFWSMFVLW